MTDDRPKAEQEATGLKARAIRRAKRLLRPTLGVFGLDSDGHLVSPPVGAAEGVEARVRDADEKDDHARVAIAEAELATERSEKQAAAHRPAPLKG